METSDSRRAKAYTISQAAALAKTSSHTVTRWLLGDQSPKRQMKSVFGPRERSVGELFVVSFLELAEIVVVARFRQDKRVKLGRLRAAHAFARKRWPDVPYPFASLKLREFGGEVLHEFEESEGHPQFLAISRAGQWVLPETVLQTLQLFDFGEDTLAVRWYPAGHDQPLMVDPRYAAGRLVIRNRRVPVFIVAERFLHQRESISSIARDLELSPREVEAAVRYAQAA